MWPHSPGAGDRGPWRPCSTGPASVGLVSGLQRGMSALIRHSVRAGGHNHRVDHKTIPVGQLLVHTGNPRHEPARSQRGACQALIGVERQKLVVLANDITEHGLRPIDRMLVIRKGRNFVVVEGNRRLVAVKLLSNPDLADGTPIHAAIKRVAKSAEVVP